MRSTLNFLSQGGSNMECLKEAWQDVVGSMDMDAAHDAKHLNRVGRNAVRICMMEGGDLQVVLLAAIMHDWVNPPKDSPLREKASRMSAEKATQWAARNTDLDAQQLMLLHESVLCHSWSAGIEPRSLEAKIVQDADNLDAVGQVGIERCLAYGEHAGRKLAHPTDPLCENRQPDDGTYTLDHFFAKLLPLCDEMKTRAGRRIGQERKAVMLEFLEQHR